MKSIMLIASLTLTTLSVFAGNEGPQAVPEHPSQVLAEYQQIGGQMVPPGFPQAYVFQILDNGTGQVKIITDSSKPEIKEVKRYNEAEVAQLQMLIKSIKPGKLVDNNPSFPGCQDGPSFSWSVHKGKKNLMIAQTKNCKKMTKKNETDSEKKIIQLLNNLELEFKGN